MAAWLRYGVNSESVLVVIEDVPSGKTGLNCPYCGGALTARKGRIKEHHFAHAEETCREVAERSDREIPQLPLYDKFNIFLTAQELEALKKLWNRYGVNNYAISPEDVLPAFRRERLLEYNEHRPLRAGIGAYEFTKLGKIPVGALSLMLFNQVQEPLILETLSQLEKKAEDAKAKDLPNLLQACLTDLRLYRAQLRRILQTTLYYLEVQAEGQTFYKIGVTSRTVEERVTEVQSDLRSHFQTIAIQVLGSWAHRGNVEKYFKYRYERANHPVGNLTEYYQFEDPDKAKAVLRDLRRMKPKVLSEAEQAILADQPSQIEQAIEAERRAEQRSQAIRKGMQKAAQWGQHLGRPSVPETEVAFLSKPASQRVIEALDRGLSLRQAAEQAGVAVNTVRKVKDILERYD